VRVNKNREKTTKRGENRGGNVDETWRKRGGDVVKTWWRAGKRSGAPLDVAADAGFLHWIWCISGQNGIESSA
jgi:hypothetical protein